MPVSKRKMSLTQKSTAKRSNQADTPGTSRQFLSQSAEGAPVDKELVNKCVRFFLARSASQIPIKRSELTKNVLPGLGRQMDAIIQQTSRVMKDVYGFEIYSTDTPQGKLYFTRNVLPPLPTTTSNADLEDREKDVHKVLTLLVLAHIFMSKKKVSEISLFEFLTKARIDPEEMHSLFGNVREYVSETLVKQKYLIREVDGVTRKASYQWGFRAETEVSKREVLNFVCKINKDKSSNALLAFKNEIDEQEARRTAPLTIQNR